MKIKMFILTMFSLASMTLSCSNATDKKQDADSTEEIPKEDKEEEKETTDKTSTSVGMVGALSLSSDIALNLTDETSTCREMDIFCQTYDETPVTCTVPIKEDCSYNTQCENLAGKTFSCFLREKEQVVSDFAFADEQTIVSGSGTLTTSASLDKSTGDVVTTVDSAASDALTTEKLEEAKIDELTPTSWQKNNLIGEWSVACVTSGSDVESFKESNFCPDGQKLYFADYDSTETEAENAKISVWTSKTVYNKCTDAVGDSTYSEQNPHWMLTLDGDSENAHDLAFDTLENFETALNNVFEALDPEIKESINTSVDLITGRNLELQTIVEAIRALTPTKFHGIINYRVPADDELRRRLLLKMFYLDPQELVNLEYCDALRGDDTLLSKYRRTHSLNPELVCQFKADGLIQKVTEYINSTVEASCLPKLFYDVIFNPFETKEDLVLFCPDSSEQNAACFNSDDDYVGGIHGRKDIMKLKLGKDKIFSMHKKRILSQKVLTPKDGVKDCKILNKRTLKAKKDSDTEFRAIFTDHFVDRCEGSGLSEIVKNFFGDHQTDIIERYQRTWKAVFTRVE